MSWVPQVSLALSDAELEAFAQHWEALATEQENRLTWDREASPEIVNGRAALYRKTAQDIRAKIGNAKGSST